MKKKNVTKKTDNIANSMAQMMDSYITLIEEDDKEINAIYKSLNKKKKSDYSASQIKELNNLNKEIKYMDDLLNNIGEDYGL